METSSPLYQITTKSGTIVADNLSNSAPVIQLHEGLVSKGSKQPKELDSGESTVVAYPLVEGRMLCHVTRTDGVDVRNIDAKPIEFIEPDPIPTKPKSTNNGVATLPVKARRGRGAKAS